MERRARAEGLVRVWDLPTRVVHWLLVGLFVLAWWTSATRNLVWHRWTGYAVLALLVFRLYWGVVGSETARLHRFLRGPSAVWTYARRLFERGGDATLGHNALAGWGAFTLFALLGLQSALGLVSVDADGLISGPLSRFVSFETGRSAASLHATVFDVLRAFIAVHLTAVLFYLLWRREDLVTPMLGGRKRLPGAPRPEPRFVPLRRVLPGLLLAAVIVFALLSSS